MYRMTQDAKILSGIERVIPRNVIDCLETFRDIIKKTILKMLLTPIVYLRTVLGYLQLVVLDSFPGVICSWEIHDVDQNKIESS